MNSPPRTKINRYTDKDEDKTFFKVLLGVENINDLSRKFHAAYIKCCVEPDLWLSKYNELKAWLGWHENVYPVHTNGITASTKENTLAKWVSRQKSRNRKRKLKQQCTDLL